MSFLPRYLLLFALILLYANVSAQITSDFSGNADGWTTPNDADATITYNAAGGNPTGFVSGSPFFIVLGAGTVYLYYYFVAPGKFLGNRSGYYDGTLRFDLQQSTTNISTVHAEAIITNGLASLYYYPASPFQPLAAPTWTTFSVALNEDAGYWKTTDSPTGPQASQAEIQAILVNLTGLQIRGLFRDANTTGRLDNVTLMPPIIINTQPSSTAVCNGVTATFTTAASGNASITYHWQLETSPTVWTDVTNTGGYSGATTATLSVNTTGNFGAGVYRGRVSGTAADDVFSSPATLTINPLPAAPSTTGNASCTSASLVLSAAGGAAGQYRWYTVPTGGIAIAGQTNNTYTTPLLAITTTYYVAINNGTCQSTRTAVIATINTPPSPPGTTGNASCGSSTIILTANGAVAGQYRWYTVPTGGIAIAGQTNSTYTTPLLAITTTYYAAINNGTCESTRTAVIATVNTPPAAPGTTGNSSCGSASLTLTASGAAAGQYRWYTVLTGGTAIAGQTNGTYTTPLLATTTTYYAAINNGTCESTRTAVAATINTPPSAPGTTGNASCGSASLTLTASGGAAGQYRWYTVLTGGTAIAGQTNSTYTTPLLATTTTYYAAINDGTCESTRTAVAATINTPPAAPGTTGNASCGSASLTLTASGAAAGQYRWYTVLTGGTAIAGQTNSTYTTPLLATTTTYYAAINNGTCESTRTAVAATINTPPSAPGTTGNASCGSASLTLTASGGAAGQYRWYTVLTGGTAIAGQTNSTYTTALLATTTTYYAAINNGTCESTRTPVAATINTPPSAPGTTGNSSCGSASLTLTASGAAAGQYRWYTVPTGGTAIAGQTNSTYTTSLLSITTPYYAAINNGTCESTRTIVTATINTPPSAPGTTGNARCGSGTVTLTASGGAAGQYRWYTVAVGGTPIAGQTNSTYTTASLSTTTTYYVAINNGICQSTRTAVTATINTPPAAPSTTGSASCGSSTFMLTASGGAAGQYRWFTTSTGGTAIAGETNDTFTTPALSITTNYYVAINDGTCQSTRASVTATVNTPPAAPSAIGAASCAAASVTLTASGASDGQYRWYTALTGGTAIPGEVNSSYGTPVLSTTTSFYAAINDGTCESTRTQAIATIATPGCDNHPPEIQITPISTQIEGVITINLADLITDSDNNIDLSTLTIVSPPSSGATATIDANFNLIIDYAGNAFTGTENITLRVCDIYAACTEQVFSIEVAGEIIIFNALSPNDDGKNETFIIENIEKLAETRKNHVTIFNRWGDTVWEGIDYNNSTTVFAGKSKDNSELPAGTYFFKIEFPTGRKEQTGFISLKR